MSRKNTHFICITLLAMAIILCGGLYRPLCAGPAPADTPEKPNAPAAYAPPAFLSGAGGTAEVLAAVKKESAKDPGLIGSHLKARLLVLLNNPERLDFSAEGLSFDPENNDISYETISINLKNALFDALNVETASIDIKNISFDAFALFAQGRLRVRSQREIAAHINVAEDDLNAYLKTKAEKIKVRKPYVRFEGEKLLLGGTFKYGIFVIKFDATGVFKIVEDTKIHFDIKRLEVNQMRMPSNFVRKVILKINPIMDLEKFPFKLVMKTIAVSGKYLIFSSKQVIK
jgi:hypothetical protein